MGYRVRTPDGELAYPTLRDVEVAYTQGLVDPNDEVLEDGHSTWRKASSIPVLARARLEKKGLTNSSQVLSVTGAVVLGALALVLIMSGSLMLRLIAFPVTMMMAALLIRVTSKAFKRPGPR